MNLSCLGSVLLTLSQIINDRHICVCMVHQHSWIFHLQAGNKIKIRYLANDGVSLQSCAERSSAEKVRTAACSLQCRALLAQIRCDTWITAAEVRLRAHGASVIETVSQWRARCKA